MSDEISKEEKATENKKLYETHKRSIVKTISWRILATITTMSLVYIFTGELTTALEVGSAEVVLKLIKYYFHERIWNRIKWGKIL